MKAFLEIVKVEADVVTTSVIESCCDGLTRDE